jgi:hypothetical protein
MNITKHTDETKAREHILYNKDKLVSLESLIGVYIRGKEHTDAQSEIVKAIHIVVHTEILLHNLFTNDIKNKLYNIEDLELLISIQKQTKNFKEQLSTTKEYINSEMSNTYIEKAIAALQNANYAGYFEEMDKVVPVSLQNPYQEHKGKFMSGNYPYNFYQQLEVFAREVDKSLSEKVANANNQNTNDNYSNSTKMNSTEKEIQGLEEVLDLLIDKKNYFQKQLLITSDTDAKFGLQQKLKELEKEIAQYKAEADKIAKEVVSKNNSTVSGNGNFVFQGIENATINVSVVNNLTEKFEKLDKEVKEMQAEKTSILLEADKQRIADIKQQLVRMNKLKSEWEEKEMLSDNPKEKMKAELEIAKLKEKMDELRKELSSL